MHETNLIEPIELAALIERKPTVIIDTRDAESFAAGHIENAVNIHDIFTYLATSSPEGLKELEQSFAERFGEAGLSGQETAVIYEDSMDSGFGQSCRGFFLLKYLGYPSVVVLHGGFRAWTAAGLPTTVAETRPDSKIFPRSEDGKDLMIDADAMMKALQDSAIVKLDVRDVDEWIGDSSSPYGRDFCPRKGRIPGAKWLEWYRMMKPTTSGSKLKNRQEILAECATIGVSEDTPVYLYCFKGARAANTFLALKEAGIKDVKLYFGSWNEWSRNTALPIESGLPY